MSQVLFLSSSESPFQITEIFKDTTINIYFSYYLYKCKVKENVQMNFEILENKSRFTNILITYMHVIPGYQSITLGTSNIYVMN